LPPSNALAQERKLIPSDQVQLTRSRTGAPKVIR
jgi:hypothetical protein